MNILVDIHTAQHIRNTITQPININSYLLVLFNVMYLVEQYCGDMIADEYKISLVDEVISSIPLYRIYQHHHMNFIIQLYKLCGGYMRLETCSGMYRSQSYWGHWYKVYIGLLILFENVLLVGGLYILYVYYG